MILLAYEIGMEEVNYLFEQALNSTINFLMIIAIEERLTNRGRTLTGRKKTRSLENSIDSQRCDIEQA